MSEENQIDSSSKPAAQIENNQIDSSTPQIVSMSKQEAPVPKWSSMNLLSVDLESVMKQLLKLSDISEPNQNEDQTYITRALGLQSLAKQCMLNDNLEMSIFYCQKASRTIDQLYNVRKDKHEEYQVLLAPFYYKKGDSLATYIEFNMDEMNQLKPLNIPDDPDFDGQEEPLSAIPEEQEEEQSKKIEETKKEEDDSQIKEKPPLVEDDVPQIEEVKCKQGISNNDSILKQSTIKDSSGVVPNQDNNNEFEELSEDIFENFQLALQIINDFIDGTNLKDYQKESLTDDIKKERKKLMSCLLIDCNNRLAEYTKFYQDCANALENYKKVIELCKEFPEGNERIQCSANFSIGVLLLEMNKREEANKHLLDAQRIQIDCLVTQLQDRGEKVTEEFKKKTQEEQVKQLQQPSIFDDDATKDMKLVLNDIGEYIRECHDAATINPQLQQIKEEAQKQKEQNGVEGDAPKGFNEKPKDAETFVQVAIKIKSKKRNLDDAQAGWNANSGEQKPQQNGAPNKTQKKVDDGEQAPCTSLFEKALGTSLIDEKTKEHSDKENKIDKANE